VSASHAVGDHPAWHVLSRCVWVPDYTSIPAGCWVKIDLGKSIQIDSYVMRCGDVPHSPKAWKVEGSTNDTTWVLLDQRSNEAALASPRTFDCNGTKGSYRYYRFSPTACQSGPFVGFIVDDFLVGGSATSGTTINFSDIILQGYREGARGLSFFVDKGAGYEQIYSLGQMPYGLAWFFNRQENVRKVKIIYQQATNVDATKAAIPNCYFFDYGPQAVTDKARLGSATAANGSPARGSYDIDCLGVAPETATILIDGVFNPMLTYAKTDADSTIFPIINNDAVPASKYLIHPFWGFVFFPGSTQTTPGYIAGTTMTISYHWGRRV